MLDHSDDETLEAVDITPGAETDGKSTNAKSRRLQAFRAEALKLEGKPDRKIAALVKIVKELLSDGFAPIVFCRFIDTANYVAEQLTASLGKNVTVRAVTGTLPPAERIARIKELAAAPGQHVLVATDCLSEGVNLQENFQAVVHYDLAWNPTATRAARRPRRSVRPTGQYGARGDSVRPRQPNRRHRAGGPAAQTRSDPQSDRGCGAGTRQQRSRRRGAHGGFVA